MSSETASKCIIHFPPARAKVRPPSVILYGTIESFSTSNWTTHLASTLSDIPITILNPRRDDWDSSWREDVSFAPFKEQVDWEMDHAAIADIIVFYFKPGTQTPITLLELGMYAGLFSKKCIVCCPEGFYKRGNVEIVCGRFGVEFLGSLEEMEKSIKKRLVELLDVGKGSNA
ncbi:hypothetical protein K458DRAFT_413363 [Lentithecium fluviatile CBS 122367]|uniref:Nucleoside 2-deoxyribosyltransferase domain-containing protein n=1 Tax=Lentithecium fluviatile CBS 122367 TaxID=1168545 RepID=A0A6G1JEZ3_9PLEO|nr:hypothetical protein K458DRAFT_413363 [Lentithecium fluviatile CBS 122367]